MSIENEMILSLACSYSGHTLLALLLDSNPNLTHLGDTILSSDRHSIVRCTCGLLTDNCNLFSRIYAWDKFEFLRSGFPSNAFEKAIFAHPYLLPIQRIAFHNFPKLSEYAKTLLAFPSNLKSITGAQFIIYGRKRICDALILKSSGIKLKIIHLTKSPFDFVLSCIQRKHLSKYDISSFAKAWAKYNSRAYKCKYFSDYFHVSFQDLCRNPESVLQQLCDFLKVPYIEQMMKPDIASQHIIGARSIVGRPFKGIIPPSTHTKVLPYHEMKKVWEITRAIATKLGYKMHENKG